MELISLPKINYYFLVSRFLFVFFSQICTDSETSQYLHLSSEESKSRPQDRNADI